MQETLSHGTAIERHEGLPLRGRDRHGTVVFKTEWSGKRLTLARLRLPDGRFVTVEGQADEHQLFGVCDTVSLVGGSVLARFQAVDWANPATIPPLDRPGALPLGAGTAILNLLAQQARRCGRQAVRYRGPYPTGSLFDALAESFRPQGDVADAFTRFTARVEETAASGEMVEVPVDFAPAPFERVWFEKGVCVQMRDGVEKVYVDGWAYARDAAGPRRVRQKGQGYVAVVEIGGAPWANVLVLDAQGQPIAGPKPLPAVDNRFVGQPLPDSVRAVLVEALPPRAPALMQSSLRQVLADVPIEWGDAGVEVAEIQEDTILLHAVLLERLEGRAPDEILTAIALAVEPVAQRLAHEAIVERHG